MHGINKELNTLYAYEQIRKQIGQRLMWHLHLSNTSTLELNGIVIA